MSVSPSVRPSVRPSSVFRLPSRVRVRLASAPVFPVPVRLPVCPSVRLSVRPSVRPSVHHLIHTNLIPEQLTIFTFPQPQLYLRCPPAVHIAQH
eukprot:5935190-Prymnesium_polylepis.1